MGKGIKTFLYGRSPHVAFTAGMIHCALKLSGDQFVIAQSHDVVLVDLHHGTLAEVWQLKGEDLLFDQPTGRSGVTRIDQVFRVLLRLYLWWVIQHLLGLGWGVDVQFALGLFVSLIRLLVGLLGSGATAEEAETTASLLFLRFANFVMFGILL